MPEAACIRAAGSIGLELLLDKTAANDEKTKQMVERPTRRLILKFPLDNLEIIS